MEKKKAVDVDTHIIGYPCYKPIIRSIKSIGDIPEFERFIFGIAKADHLSDADMVEQLDGLTQSYLFGNCVLFGADFYRIFEEPVAKNDLPSLILSQKKIRTHTQCAAYYKEYQSNQNACFACPRSPYFKNKYLREELSVLKYMLSGEECCKYIEEKVPDLSIEFLGVFDIFFDQRIKTSVYLPMNQLFYNYISANDSTLFFDSMTKSPEARIDYLMDWFDDDYLRLKEIPIEYKSQNIKKEVAFRRHFERINEACDLTKADIDGLLVKMKSFQEERKEIIESFSHLSPSLRSTYISYSSQSKRSDNKNIPSKKSEEKPEQTYFDISVQIFAAANTIDKQKASEDAPHSVPMPEKYTQEPVMVHTSTQLQTDHPESDTENVKGGMFEKCLEPSKDTPSFTLCIYNTEKHFLSTDYPKSPYQKEKLIPYREVSPLLDSSLPMEFRLTAEQLSAFHPINGNLISLAEIEDAAFNDRCIAIEAVSSLEGLLLVLSTATRHLFASTDLTNAADRKVIGQLFKRNGIKKVCHMPYLLYAFCYEKGLKINGVHSILTHHYFLNPGTSVFGLRDIILENITSNIDYIRKKLQTTNNLLYDALRHYKKVFLCQERKSKRKNTSNLSLMQEFDQAIGYSYLLSGSMDTAARLFERKKDYQIVFHNNLYQELTNKVRFSGYFSTYEFPVSTKHATNIITRFLCNLSKEYVFGEYNIQIVALYKNRVTFFIAKEEFDYLDAVITSTLRFVASQYGQSFLQISVIYEYHKSASEPTTNT